MTIRVKLVHIITKAGTKLSNVIRIRICNLTLYSVPSDVVVSLRIVNPSACEAPANKAKASVKNIGLDIVFFALLKGFTYLAS